MADTINLKRKDIFTLFLSSLCLLEFNDQEHTNSANTIQENSNLINKANKNTK